jgi:hypothetical protein
MKTENNFNISLADSFITSTKIAAESITVEKIDMIRLLEKLENDVLFKRLGKRFELLKRYNVLHPILYKFCNVPIIGHFYFKYRLLYILENEGKENI